MKALIAEYGKDDRAFGLSSAPQEFQDQLSHVALVDVASVDRVEHNEDGARLTCVGSVRVLVRPKLRRNHRGLRRDESVERARFSSLLQGEIGLLQIADGRT